MDRKNYPEVYAIYTRQSVESQLEVNSCQAQFDDCMEYAQRELSHAQWIGEQFDDKGISGATLGRPALKKLRDKIAAGGITHLLITYLDRLSRRLRDFSLLMNEIQNFGVKLHVVKLPVLDIKADGQFLTNIMASFAEFERDVIRERLEDTRAYLKRKGRRLAGRIPLGYNADPVTKQLVINKKEAMQVETIFAIAAKGDTPASIAELLNQKGWRTKAYIASRSDNISGGNPWSARQIIALLRNPVYIGKFKDGNTIRPGIHEAIVDPALFEIVQEHLDSRRTKRPGSKRQLQHDGFFPLRGKIVCPGCGRKLNTDTGERSLGRGSKVVYRYYRCRSTAGGRPPCKAVRYPANEIEQFVCDCLGEPVTWQKFIRRYPAKTDMFNEAHHAWNMLDDPLQRRYIRAIVDEVKIINNNCIQITLNEHFLEILPKS